MMHHAKQLGTLRFYKALYKQITGEDLRHIREWCYAGIRKYFG